MAPSLLKPCRTCGQVLPLSCFPVDRAQATGTRGHCRPCWLQLEKQRREKRGPEYARALSRRYYQRHAEQRRAAQRAYYARTRTVAQKTHQRRPRPPLPLPPAPPPPPPSAPPPAPPARLTLRVRSEQTISEEIRQLERAMRSG